MGMSEFIGLISIIVLVSIISGKIEQKKIKKKLLLMTPDERQKYQERKLVEEAQQKSELIQRNQEIQYGATNAAMMCPHCQTNGKIRTKHVQQKKGISGGKAVATVLTGGLSLLAVGLSRKEGATQAHCENCNNTWFF